MLLAASVVAQLVALYVPPPGSGTGVPHLDKVVHLAVFAAVAYTGRRAGLPWSGLAAALVVHAGVSEVVQATVLPGRDGDLRDLGADLLGTAAGLALARRGRESPRPADGAMMGG